MLELSFRRLTAPQTEGQRVVLLVDGINGLHRPVLRYLQQAGRNAPGLTFVIAGAAALPAMLSEGGFAELRDRLTARPALVASAGDAANEDETAGPVLAAVAALLAASPQSQASPAAAASTRWPTFLVNERSARVSARKVLPWAAAGAGMAASLAFGAWIGQAPTPPAPLRPAPQAPARADQTAAADRAPKTGVAGRARGRARIGVGLPLETATASKPRLAQRAPADLASGAAPASAELGAAAPLAGADLAIAATPSDATMPPVSPAPGVERAVPPELATLAAAPPALRPSAAPALTALEEGGAAPKTVEAQKSEAGKASAVRRGSEDFAASSQPAAPSGPAGADPRRVEAATAARARTEAAARAKPERPARGPASRRGDNVASAAPRPRWIPPLAQYPETAGYGWENRLPRGGYARPYEWRGARYAPAPKRPYIGTYTAGPYGGRVFRYEP